MILPSRNTLRRQFYSKQNGRKGRMKASNNNNKKKKIINGTHSYWLRG
jgi:hypothetical protein